MAAETNQKVYQNREAKKEFLNCFLIDEKAMKLSIGTATYICYVQALARLGRHPPGPKKKQRK